MNPIREKCFYKDIPRNHTYIKYLISKNVFLKYVVRPNYTQFIKHKTKCFK